MIERPGSHMFSQMERLNLFLGKNVFLQYLANKRLYLLVN